MNEGEIPLADLARIADETQQLVHRLGRSLAGQSGPGRSATFVEEATKLTFVGIQRGSTLLQIAGPVVDPELFTDDSVPPPIGVQAVELVVDGLQALDANQALPPAFDDPSTGTLRSWLGALASVSESVVVSGASPGRSRTCRIDPRATGERVPVGEPTLPLPRDVTVEGVLYAVNLHTGRYHIEDDAGNKISLVLDAVNPDDIGPLVNRRVRAEGLATRDATRRIQLVTANSIALAPDDPTGIETPQGSLTLGELLSGVEPIGSTDELVIELGAEEAAAFLAALDE